MNKLFLVSIVTAGIVGCGGGCHWPFGSAVNGRIDVSPSMVCPGSPMTVSWNATGSSIAVFAPDGALIGSSTTGSLSVPAPASSGAFRLEVDGESVNASFQVQAGLAIRPIFISVGCGEVSPGLWGVQGTGFVSNADSRIRVTGLRAPGRTYAEVGHNSLRASLVSGGTIPVPPTESWSGTYTVTSLLENLETCASPPDPGYVTAPSVLQVEAFTECR